MKNQEQKESFIIQWMIRRDCGIDMLNTDFVDAYVDEFQPSHSIQLWGASKCPELSRLLSNMWKEGKLRRSTVSINGMSGMGFPKWIYHYHIR